MTGYRTRTPEQGTTRLAAADRWSWTDDAACRGESLELFFGRDGERAAEREAREAKAKEICAACPVRTSCADYAVARPERHGTWGGYTPEERVTIRRSRQRSGTLEGVGMCTYGHARTEANTIYDTRGYARCRPCHRNSKNREAAA